MHSHFGIIAIYAYVCMCVNTRGHISVIWLIVNSNTKNMVYNYPTIVRIDYQPQKKHDKQFTFNTQCTAYSLRRTLYDVHCLTYSVRRTVYNVRLTLYTMCIVRCKVFVVQSVHLHNCLLSKCVEDSITDRRSLQRTMYHVHYTLHIRYTVQ